MFFDTGLMLQRFGLGIGIGLVLIVVIILIVDKIKPKGD